MAIIRRGQEPANIKKRLDTLFPKLNEAYPDKVIRGLARDHKKWAETVTELYRALGYPDSESFLKAYGYTVERGSQGRPSGDHMAIIDELKTRYPNGTSFEKMDELKDANPDLAGKFKTLSNRSKELFGMTLADYFKSIGLLGGSDHKKQLDDLIAELKRRYPEGTALPATLAELKENNADLMVHRLSYTKDVYGVNPQQDQLSEALIEQFIKAVAEHYKMELSVKITRGKMANAYSCHFNGGSVPYGYQIDDEKHYQIDPDQAPVVLDVFRRFAAGVPMAELLRDLETKGVRNAKGNCYSRKTLTKLLSNRIYIGEYRYTDIVIPDGVPAIVDKELFDAVAARLANPNCR